MVPCERTLELALEGFLVFLHHRREDPPGDGIEIRQDVLFVQPLKNGLLLVKPPAGTGEQVRQRIRLVRRNKLPKRIFVVADVPKGRVPKRRPLRLKAQLEGLERRKGCQSCLKARELRL